MFHPSPGYTSEFFRLLKKGEKVDADEKKMGWVECVENGNVSFDRRTNTASLVAFNVTLQELAEVSRVGIIASQHNAEIVSLLNNARCRGFAS